MVGWHHQLNRHEFEQTPGDGDGQGGLASCSPWGHKESDRTERLNNTITICVLTLQMLKNQLNIRSKKQKDLTNNDTLTIFQNPPSCLLTSV